MKKAVFGVVVIILGAAWTLPVYAKQQVTRTHALVLQGEPKYPLHFQHFDYVNSNAPKGGQFRLSATGTFDTLNAFTLKGVPVIGTGYLYDTLMTPSADEPNTAYGLLAESVEIPADCSWVKFNLRKEARWQDGRPITADDVIFSFETLKTKGHPNYRFYYASVTKAVKIGPSEVKFVFAEGQNRELPYIVGQLPILPKHYWKNKDFTKTTLEAPLGSGPYRIAKVVPGRSITYQRNAKYWGRNLPVNRGSNNFNIIHYDYYRDSTVALQAFLAGQYDFRLENTAKDWATAYSTHAVKEGKIKKEEIHHRNSQGMQAFVFNLRKPIFQDRRVRQALNALFDFEWSNKNLFYGQYTRSKSYFSNSEFAATGLPSALEKEILLPVKGQIPDEVLTQEFWLPVTDGSGRIRQQTKQAYELLKSAGWEIKNGNLTNKKTGRRFTFEILLDSPTFERIALPFVKNLKRLGIKARLRTVDDAQYQQRVKNFDFDMIVDIFAQSLSPGNEQLDYWGSVAAKEPGSRNTIGIQNPAVDYLIKQIIAAHDRESLVARTRALDRVLLWNYYVIPHWYSGNYRVAYWNTLSRPAKTPPYQLALETWWSSALTAAKAKTE